MKQIGFVKRVYGDKVELEVRRVSGCGESCKGCSGSCNTPSHIISLPNKVNAKAGDYVEIQAKTKNIMKYTAIAYIIPLVMLISGILIGTKIFKTLQISNYELLSFLTGIVFLVISYFIVKIVDKKIEKKGENAMEIFKVL